MTAQRLCPPPRGEDRLGAKPRARWGARAWDSRPDPDALRISRRAEAAKLRSAWAALAHLLDAPALYAGAPHPARPPAESTLPARGREARVR
jgi:hypothetical protein